MARERYHMPLVMRTVTKDGVAKSENYFKTADDIADATIQGGMYALEKGGGPGGGVTHMALLYNGTVYECTTNQPVSACISSPLSSFVSRMHGAILYLFGPLVG
jgi:hypothetical protein